MTNFTQSELQALDGLQTDAAILAAIEDFTGSKFLRDGRIDEGSAAYAEWSNGYNAESIVEAAWAALRSRGESRNHDRLLWGASSFANPYGDSE